MAPADDTTARPDLGAGLLEWGLGAVIVIAPLPFGAVVPGGRLMLELSALLLLLVWCVRAWQRETPAPPRAVAVGLIGLLALAAFQTLPLGSGAVSLISPASLEIRDESTPSGAVLAAERGILGQDPSALDAPSTLSVDPGATASALRTGAALAALLLVATTVAACRGARGLAAALLLSGGLQGLYGVLVVASGHDRIWHIPKRHFLDSATGTFVNRNHFACYLAMTLACGLALLLHDAKRDPYHPPRGARFAAMLGAEGGRRLLLGLLLLSGIAGLFLSYSRAGIAVGLLALGLTVFAPGRGKGLRTRLVVTLLVILAACIPMFQLGSGGLVGRLASVGDELTGARGTVWRDTGHLLARFPVTGSGFGTFAEIYPVVRSAEIRKFFAHAHNDPLQVGAEGGILGLLFVGLIAVPVLVRLGACLVGGKGTLATGFAAGLVAVLLHSMVDFNFHIPANAATAAILAGTILGMPWKVRTSD